MNTTTLAPVMFPYLPRLIVELPEAEYHLLDASEDDTVKLSDKEGLALRIQVICNPLFCRK